MRKLIVKAAMPIIRHATRSYITGPHLDDAIALANSAGESGYGSTICYWNDGTEEPRMVADNYLRILDRMQTERLDGYLALKVPALWDNVDLASEVIAHARSLGIKVMLDSHAPEQADAVFSVLDRVGPEQVGCAIPGRWRRSLRDAERAIELGVSVRVVKGQWPDPEEPGMDLRESYLRIIDRLAGRAVHVGVATHDPALAADAFTRLNAAGTRCEQELVFPLPMTKALEAAQSAGVTTRLYIPYGSAWLPYSISRAMQNPSVIVYFLRDLLTNNRFRLPPPPAKPAS
jgi:proline dehydrogenase